jgi:hypothetical protein
MSINSIRLKIWVKKCVKGSVLSLGPQDLAYSSEKFSSLPRIIFSHFKKDLWDRYSTKGALSW